MSHSLSLSLSLSLFLFLSLSLQLLHMLADETEIISNRTVMMGIHYLSSSFILFYFRESTKCRVIITVTHFMKFLEIRRAQKVHIVINGDNNYISLLYLIGSELKSHTLLSHQKPHKVGGIHKWVWSSCFI